MYKGKGKKEETELQVRAEDGTGVALEEKKGECKEQQNYQERQHGTRKREVLERREHIIFKDGTDL